VDATFFVSHSLSCRKLNRRERRSRDAGDALGDCGSIGAWYWKQNGDWNVIDVTGRTPDHKQSVASPPAARRRAPGSVLPPPPPPPPPSLPSPPLPPFAFPRRRLPPRGLSSTAHRTPPPLELINARNAIPQHLPCATDTALLSFARSLLSLGCLPPPLPSPSLPPSLERRVKKSMVAEQQLGGGDAAWEDPAVVDRAEDEDDDDAGEDDEVRFSLDGGGGREEAFFELSGGGEGRNKGPAPLSSAPLRGLPGRARPRSRRRRASSDDRDRGSGRPVALFRRCRRRGRGA